MIMKDLPRPDTSRFSQISPELLVLSYLVGSKRALSLGTLKTKLKAFVSPQRIEEAVSALVAGHQAIAKKTIELTRKGKDAVEKALGRDAGRVGVLELPARCVWQTFGRVLIRHRCLNPQSRRETFHDQQPQAIEQSLCQPT
jgi:hypothetical protein